MAPPTPQGDQNDSTGILEQKRRGPKPTYITREEHDREMRELRAENATLRKTIGDITRDRLRLIAAAEQQGINLTIRQGRPRGS